MGSANRWCCNSSFGAGVVIDIAGTAAVPIVNVDLSEAPAAVYAPATDFLMFLDGGTSGTAAKESGVDFATALAGAGLTAAAGVLSRDTIALTTDTSGNYVATITGGTGIDSTGATTGEGIAHRLSVDLNELTTETGIAAGDFIAMVDITDSGSGKITLTNFSAQQAGAGLTATTGTLSVDDVALGTSTTGDFVGTITGGVGIDSTGGTTGEDYSSYIQCWLGRSYCGGV